jgi:RNA binding exosome subunit
LTECDAFEALRSIITRLDDVEFLLMLSGIEESRLYVKFDKQQAYRGVLKVSHGDDVVYVEVRGKTLAMRGDMRTFLTSLREALKR